MGCFFGCILWLHVPGMFDSLHGDSFAWWFSWQFAHFFSACSLQSLLASASEHFPHFGRLLQVLAMCPKHWQLLHRIVGILSSWLNSYALKIWLFRNRTFCKAISKSDCFGMSILTVFKMVLSRLMKRCAFATEKSLVSSCVMFSSENTGSFGTSFINTEKSFWFILGLRQVATLPRKCGCQVSPISINSCCDSSSRWMCLLVVLKAYSSFLLGYHFAKLRLNCELFLKVTSEFSMMSTELTSLLGMALCFRITEAMQVALVDCSTLVSVAKSLVWC